MGIKDSNMVPTLLHTINISDPVSAGGTKFKDCLKRITDERINRLKAYKDICSQRPYDRHDHPKPLNLIVVTDGEADEEEALENFLVDTANELEHLAAPANFIGFQFVQVGDSIEASAYLKRLDDDLHIAYQVWDVSDFCYFSSEAQQWR